MPGISISAPWPQPALSSRWGPAGASRDSAGLSIPRGLGRGKQPGRGRSLPGGSRRKRERAGERERGGGHKCESWGVRGSPGSCKPPRPPGVQQRRGEHRAQGLHAEAEIKVIPCKLSEEQRVRSPVAAGPGASIRRNPMLSPAGRGWSGSAPGQHHGPFGCTPRSHRALYAPLSPLRVIQPACNPLPPPPGTAWFPSPCHLLLQAMQAAPHWHPRGQGVQAASAPTCPAPHPLRAPHRCSGSPAPHPRCPQPR